MPWYKAGTVSVVLNSNAVIGTGTAFIANSRVGDAFRGPDGGWYEVTNIASDTALSISPNYQGATNAAGIYALAPMQGYVKDSADQLRSLVNLYGAKMAALGTTGNYDILPVTKGGTGIADLSAFIQGMLSDADAPSTRTTLGAAKSGANSDITSLDALTTPLSVGQGGTGSNSAASARIALGLKTASIADMLGTVSQTLGVPTGALQEAGSNANGWYYRFANGLQVCFLAKAAAFTINIGYNGAFAASGGLATVQYPATFSAQPAISIEVNGTGGPTFLGYTSMETMDTTFTGWPGIIPYSTVARSAQYYTVSYIAVGRWF